MINPDLERRFSDCTALKEEWGNFRDLVMRSLRTTEGIAPQYEQQFLQTKARIAMLHDSFMESIKNDKPTGAKMLELVNRSITLKSLRKASEPEQKKTESEWHEIFLALNETISTLNDERSRLANVNEFTHKMGKIQHQIFINVKAFVGSFLFKVAAVFVVLVVTIVGVQLFGVYDYDDLRDQKWAAPVVKVYLNSMRAIYSRDMAYYSVADAVAKVGDTTGANKTPDTASFSKESAAADLGGMKYANPQVTDALNKAAGFEHFTFTKTDGFGTASANIFWFRKGEDARNAGRLVQNGPPSLLSLRRANVLVIIDTSDPSFGSAVRTQSFSKI